jgi:hypothetical protein
MDTEDRLPDFDTLAAMYRHDPEGYENYRRRILRQAVDSAPNLHRADLEQLLVRIEQARNQAATPEEAARIAFDMMNDSVRQLNRTWKRAHHAIAGVQTELALLKARQR